MRASLPVQPGLTAAAPETARRPSHQPDGRIPRDQGAQRAVRGCVRYADAALGQQAASLPLTGHAARSPSTRRGDPPAFASSAHRRPSAFPRRSCRTGPAGPRPSGRLHAEEEARSAWPGSTAAGSRPHFQPCVVPACSATTPRWHVTGNALRALAVLRVSSEFPFGACPVLACPVLCVTGGCHA